MMTHQHLHSSYAEHQYVHMWLGKTPYSQWCGRRKGDPAGCDIHGWTRGATEKKSANQYHIHRSKHALTFI